MTDKSTDVAALAAGVIAVAATTVTASGAYDATDCIVGLATGCLLIGFVFGHERTLKERLAVAAVSGLAAIPIFGYLLAINGAANDYKHWYVSLAAAAFLLLLDWLLSSRPNSN